MANELSLHALFALAGFTPNPNQLRAIEHTAGPLFLVAGPGSGKTRVLLWRTVNLIVFHGIEPNRIFLGTFTEKAARQLKDGLLSLLTRVTNQTGRAFDLSRMYVGTIHSLCERILRDRAFSPGRARTEAPAVLDALDQYFEIAAAAFWREARQHLSFEGELEALRTQLNAHFDVNSPSKHKAVANLQALFNRFSEENLSPDTLLAAESQDSRDLCALYKLYRSRLGTKRVDLSLLQQAAYQLLCAHEVGTHAFDHVIVDEYQDTNAIQEKIFFRLASSARNLCVVGDDDQALYRFRGATVENFVQFPERCISQLGQAPQRIELNTNYRSRQGIVSFYGRFIEQTDWRRGEGGFFRLHDKNIQAHRQDPLPAVVASSPAGAEAVAEEVARLVRRLIDSGRVSDPNQIAFLFPSLKSVRVEHHQRALEAVGLRVYAPRARRFLEAEEPTAMVGLLGLILGRPPRSEDFDRGEYREFHNWLDECASAAQTLMRADARLARFVKDRQEELSVIRKDFTALTKVIDKEKWVLTAPYSPAEHKRLLLSATGLSERGKRALGAAHLDRIAAQRLNEGKPALLGYVLNRATSVDWGVLDLFYRLCGFDHFKAMFDLAEEGSDEGPVCNLALTSQYLARYIDTFPSIIAASAFDGNRLQNGFYYAFLFALFRLGEGEFEDAEDPFPKGRIPFLTVHQSKGLEFPVVVLGSLHPANRKVQTVETLVRPFLKQDGEPLDRMGDFDAMRMFYVALSRAQNLLILPHNKGQGQQLDRAFQPLLQDGLTRIPALDVQQLPPSSPTHSELARTYSYTSDYLGFLRCPRQYMLFQKYGFAASRTQTMFFGSLVHQTIEDLHNRLISLRAATTPQPPGGQAS